MAITEREIYRLMGKRVRVVDRSPKSEACTPIGIMTTLGSDKLPVVLYYRLDINEWWCVEFQDLKKVDMRPRPDKNVTELWMPKEYYHIKKYVSKSS